MRHRVGPASLIGLLLGVVVAPALFVTAAGATPVAGAPTGFIEICKQAAANSNLTGSYSFTLTGSGGFSSTATATVGECSGALQVPAGQVTVTEAGTNLYVTGIAALINNATPALVGSPNLTTGTATVTVNPSTDTSTQTDVTYTNNTVLLKICKVFDTANGAEPGGSTTTFPFSFSASGPAGPNTAQNGVSLQAGTCANPVAYRPGTTVSVTEGAVTGTKVESIGVTGAQSVVPGSLSTLNGTVSIVIGTPVTSPSASGNEAVVTFTDEAAAPGQLKICKLAGTPAPSGTQFSFTVTGFQGPLVVSLGSCIVVGTFPFNSVVTITESGSSGNSASGITTVPTSVQELVGGVLTATSEPVLSGQPNLGSTGTTSSVTVVIGESNTTEVSFTDVTTPPQLPLSNAVVTVANPGGSQSGTTTAATNNLAKLITLAAPAASGSTVPSAVSPLTGVTAAEAKAELRHDRKALVNVKATLHKWERVLATTKGARHRSAARRLAVLKAEQRALRSDIGRLG